MKKFLWIFAALLVRFVFPIGLITDWRFHLLLKEPAVGLSLLGMIVGGVVLWLLNKTFKDMLKDEPNSHIGVFLFKLVRSVIFTGIAVGLFVFLGAFSQTLWIISLAFGLSWIVSEVLLYQFYTSE